MVGGGGMRPNTATSRSLLAFASTTLSIVCLAARGWEDYVNRNGNAFVIGIMRTTVRTTVSTHS